MSITIHRKAKYGSLTTFNDIATEFTKQGKEEGYFVDIRRDDTLYYMDVLRRRVVEYSNDNVYPVVYDRVEGSDIVAEGCFLAVADDGIHLDVYVEETETTESHNL